MKIQSPPPRLAVWLIQLIIDEEFVDAILGDLEEEYQQAVIHDPAKSAWFFWKQILSSCVSLLYLKVIRQFERSLNMSGENKKLFWLSLLFLFPAIMLVTIGVLQSGFGITSPNDAMDAMFQKYPSVKLIYHPLLLISGLLTAVLINLLRVMKLQWDSQEQSISATLTIKNKLMHWILLGVGTFLIAAILAYGVMENFNIIPR